MKFTPASGGRGISRVTLTSDSSDDGKDTTVQVSASSNKKNISFVQDESLVYWAYTEYNGEHYYFKGNELIQHVTLLGQSWSANWLIKPDGTPIPVITGFRNSSQRGIFDVNGKVLRVDYASPRSVRSGDPMMFEYCDGFNINGYDKSMNIESANQWTPILQADPPSIVWVTWKLGGWFGNTYTKKFQCPHLRSLSSGLVAFTSVGLINDSQVIGVEGSYVVVSNSVGLHLYDPVERKVVEGTPSIVRSSWLWGVANPATGDYLALISEDSLCIKFNDTIIVSDIAATSVYHIWSSVDQKVFVAESYETTIVFVGGVRHTLPAGAYVNC